MNKKLLSVIAISLFSMTTAFGANYAVEQPNVYQQPYMPYYNQSYQQYPQYSQPITTQYNPQDLQTQAQGQYPLPDYQTQYPLPNYQAQQYLVQYQQPLQGNVVMVPAGTTFNAVTTSSLNSATASLGEMVSFVMSSDFYYGGKLIAAAGSRVNGTVTQVRKSGMAGKNGRIGVRFTNILTPMGQMIPISGVIQTDDGSGVLYASAAKDTAKEYVKDVGIGAGLGAALGTAMGPLSGGSVGKGAIYGTALGAGLGLTQSLMYRGKEVEIPANAQLQIKIDQPITINSNTNF